MDRRTRALDKEVDWIVAHPARARAWSESGKISAVAMGATLALGLFVHVLGYQIGIGAAPVPDWIPRELAATLVANLGIVLWTSVVLVVFLDTLPARAHRRAAGSMALAARKLEERGLPVPAELAGVDAAATADVSRAPSDPTLDAVLERLTAIERLLAQK